MTTATQTKRSAKLRPTALLAGAVMALTLLTACGSDDAAATPEEAFCDAGDSLRTDVESLGDLDLVAEGTDGIQQQFDAISSDLEQLRDSGQDVASQEIDTLDSALTQLESTVETLGDAPSARAVADAASSVKGVVDSARAVLDKLDSTCS